MLGGADPARWSVTRSLRLQELLETMKGAKSPLREMRVREREGERSGEALEPLVYSA